MCSNLRKIKNESKKAYLNKISSFVEQNHQLFDSDKENDYYYYTLQYNNAIIC